MEPQIGIADARDISSHGSEMQKFVDAMQKELTAEDIDTNIEGCIGCGNCGHACNWYMSTDDPDLHPKTKSDIVRKIYKYYLSPAGKLPGKLNLKEKPTIKDLEKLSDLSWKCTMCGRCALSCMQGVSNRRLSWIGRSALSAAGIGPKPIHVLKENSRIYGHAAACDYENSMGKIVTLSKEEGLEVPVDVEGADYLWVCAALGNTKIVDKSPAVVKILNYLGIKYTISSKIIDTGLEVHQIACDRTLGPQLMKAVEDEAKRLKVKAILMPECPCDMRTYFVEAERWLGRPFDVEVDQLDLLVLDYAKQGKLPLEKLDKKVTLHDPCWSVRLTGYVEEPRELLKMCVTDFVEMTPNREYNYCCNGGAGTMKLYPPDEEITNRSLRRQVSEIKYKQIEATNAEMVAIPCAACFLSIRDTLKHYESDVEPEVMIDIVSQSMEAALKKKGKSEMDKMKLPWNMKKKE